MSKITVEDYYEKYKANVDLKLDPEGYEGARWSDAAEAALLLLGASNGYRPYTVVDSMKDGDYQGSASLLAKGAYGRYVFMEWAWGSCSGCDGYEDLSAEGLGKAFLESMSTFKSAEHLATYLGNRTVYAADGGGVGYEGACLVRYYAYALREQEISTKKR